MYQKGGGGRIHGGTSEKIRTNRWRYRKVTVLCGLQVKQMGKSGAKRENFALWQGREEEKQGTTSCRARACGGLVGGEVENASRGTGRGGGLNQA